MAKSDIGQEATIGFVNWLPRSGNSPPAEHAYHRTVAKERFLFGSKPGFGNKRRTWKSRDLLGAHTTLVT
jgi:hypothetical protein